MKSPRKRPPRLATVAAKNRLTPNMIRITLTASWMRDLQRGQEGANFKLFLPEPDEAQSAFEARLIDGPRPTVRTYTIRALRPDAEEIDVDFVDHGSAGPASAFARNCAPGDICGFAGPGPLKIAAFEADTYILAADMSALPVVSATLEAMPRDATGAAFLEITSPEDRQPIDAPDGIDLHWLVHADPSTPPTQAVALIEALPHTTGRVQTCIAGESSMIRALREEILISRGVPKADAYISGYWKIGLVEDEHQVFKRQDGA